MMSSLSRLNTKNMKKIYLKLIFIIVTFSSSAQFDPEAELILESMSTKYKSKSAFMSTFEQNLINEMSVVNESISGTIYVKGDKYKLEIAGQIGLPDWVDVDPKKMTGVMKSLPGREDILPDINENLVVELYSK